MLGDCYLPERLARVREKSLLVCDDVGVFDGGQNAHLIEGVLLLLLAQVDKLDLLKRVLLVISQPPHSVDRGVRPLAFR